MIISQERVLEGIDEPVRDSIELLVTSLLDESNQNVNGKDLYQSAVQKLRWAMPDTYVGIWKFDEKNSLWQAPRQSPISFVGETEKLDVHFDSPGPSHQFTEQLSSLLSSNRLNGSKADVSSEKNDHFVVEPILTESCQPDYVVAISKTESALRANSKPMIQIFAQIVAKLRDVNQRHSRCVQAERAHAALAKFSPLPVGTISRDGTVLDWNHALESFSGRNKDDIIGQKIEKIFRHSDEELKSLYGSVAEYKFPRTFLLKAVLKNGRPCCAELTLIPVLDEFENVASILLVVKDLSQFTSLEHALKGQQLACATLAECNSLDESWIPLLSALGTHFGFETGTVWKIRKDHQEVKQVACWRSRACKFTDNDSQSLSDHYPEVVGRAATSKSIEWSNNRLSTTHSAGMSRIDDGNPLQLIRIDEVALPIMHDKDLHSVLVLSGPMNFREKSSVNNVLITIGEVVSEMIIRDQLAESLQSTEDSLRQNRKMESLGMMAGAIAHDFNNVLAIILGNSELALDAMPADSPVRESLEHIQTAGEKAAALTRKILTFSRKSPCDSQLLHVNEAIREQLPMLTKLVGQDVTVQLVLSTSTHPVMIDPIEFEQVLINFVVNARDAIATSGEISIATSAVQLRSADVRSLEGVKSGEFIVIKIRDNGHGMDAETQERIFEPFFTTKDRDHGTGLGLATVHGIVKRAGGFLHVESEIGEGTEFSVHLPVASVGIAPQSTEELGKAPMNGTGRIVVIDDDDVLRKLVARILTVHGFTATTFQEGREAINYVAEHLEDVDLVLTDATMPGMSGLDVIEEVRQRFQSLPIAMMTGFSESEHLNHPQYDGIPILRKPFKSIELIELLVSLLN